MRTRTTFGCDGSSGGLGFKWTVFLDLFDFPFGLQAISVFNDLSPWLCQFLPSVFLSLLLSCVEILLFALASDPRFERTLVFELVLCLV